LLSHPHQKRDHVLVVLLERGPRGRRMAVARLRAGGPRDIAQGREPARRRSRASAIFRAAAARSRSSSSSMSRQRWREKLPPLIDDPTLSRLKSWL
jgi:hypothetical protein